MQTNGTRNKKNLRPLGLYVYISQEISPMSVKCQRKIAYERFNFRLCKGRFGRVRLFTLSIISFRIDVWAMQQNLYYKHRPQTQTTNTNTGNTFQLNFSCGCIQYGWHSI